MLCQIVIIFGGPFVILKQANAQLSGKGIHRLLYIMYNISHFLLARNKMYKGAAQVY